MKLSRDRGGAGVSPDGSKIAFDSNRDGKAVWVMNADGSGQTKLTNKPMSIEGLPVFSPGGSTRHDSVSHTCEHTSR